MTVPERWRAMARACGIGAWSSVDHVQVLHICAGRRVAERVQRKTITQGIGRRCAPCSHHATDPDADPERVRRVQRALHIG